MENKKSIYLEYRRAEKISDFTPLIKKRLDHFTEG